VNLTTHKITICILFLCLIGTTPSCKEREQHVNIQLSLENSEVEGRETGQFMLLEIDPDRPWTISVGESEDWVFVNPTSGVGESWIIVTTAENGSQPRTATITATSGISSASIELTQLPIALVEVFGNTSFPNTGANRTLQIQTNLAWTASITAGSSFARLGSTTSGTGNGAINVTFDPNPSGVERSANLRVTVAEQEVNLTLNQGLSTARPEQDIPFRLELPEVRNSRWFIDHNYLALEFDTAQRHSVWVAFVFNSALRQSTVSRTDRWAYDPLIPEQYQWAFPRVVNRPSDMPSLTVAGQFDRGHIVASEDRVSSLLANWETFYISNISPQFSRFNQSGGLWYSLEGRVRAWARNFDTLYVVKGAAINRAGTVYTVQGEQLRFGGVETLGTIPERNNVTIAKYWFMTMVGRTGDTFTGIAFWFENSQDSRGPSSVLHQHAITIRQLEHKTGINFFPNLGIAFPAIYEFVENNINLSNWPL
jgi:endonuclease G